MKAIVFHGIGDIRVDNVKEPSLKEHYDAIVRITSSAICGTDLHLVRGTMPGMRPGTILGHEAVGIVEAVGRNVRNIRPGDRVVVAAGIACGYCSYCRCGYFSQCDNANPNGSESGGAFLGSPQAAGGYHGVQAEYARIPFANVGLLRLPEDVSDNAALLLSDILPTGYFAADLAEIKPGNTVAVFGCGPIGICAIASAFMKGASRVFAVDRVPYRLEIARLWGAEIINFEREDPVEAIKNLTGGIGCDRTIDAVGVDAEPPHGGPAFGESARNLNEYKQEVKKVAPKANPDGPHWQPGRAPSQAIEWCIEATCKAGTLSVVGVYPDAFKFFSLGKAFDKNLTIKGGGCDTRRYMPKLLDMIKTGRIHPERIISNVEPMAFGVEAYKMFDTRRPGWLKVELVPSGKTEVYERHMEMAHR